MKKKIAKRTTKISYAYTVYYYSINSCNTIALAEHASLAEALKHTHRLIKNGFDVTLTITQSVDEGKVLHEYEKNIFYEKKNREPHTRLSGYTFARAIKRPHNSIIRRFWQ